MKPPIYMGQGQDFLVKMRGLSIHWYVIHGFESNNALYSARLPFTIFLLTPFNTRNCCSLNQISGCCLLKWFSQKNVMLFCSQWNVKNFPSWVYFCFYPAFHWHWQQAVVHQFILEIKADFRVRGPESRNHIWPCAYP